MLSQATEKGLSFCGGTEWYPALEFTTPSASVSTTTTTVTTIPQTTTTTTKPGTTYTRINLWEYCKDSALSKDCPAIFTTNVAVAYYDPQALDTAHKLNAFFVDLAAPGSLGAIPNETSFITLDPGDYQFRVRVSANTASQLRLSVEGPAGTFDTPYLFNPSSGYNLYTYNFTLTTRQDVRLRLRKNDSSPARIMVDRYELFKAQ